MAIKMKRRCQHDPLHIPPPFRGRMTVPRVLPPPERGRVGVGVSLRSRLMRTLGLGLIVVIGMTPAAQAQWPDRPIKLIVQCTAGSSSDIIARVVAAKVGERLGQQIVVDNRVGGSTIIGTD